MKRIRNRARKGQLECRRTQKKKKKALNSRKVLFLIQYFVVTKLVQHRSRIGVAGIIRHTRKIQGTETLLRVFNRSISFQKEVNKGTTTQHQTGTTRSICHQMYEQHPHHHELDLLTYCNYKFNNHDFLAKLFLKESYAKKFSQILRSASKMLFYKLECILNHRLTNSTPQTCSHLKHTCTQTRHLQIPSYSL